MVKKRYSFNKVIIFLLIFMILTSNILIVHTGPLDWIKEAKDKVEEGITAEIMQDLSNQIVATFTSGIDGFLVETAEMFNPSLNLFYTMANGMSISSATDYTYDNSPEVIALFRSYSVYAGATLASILYFFGMFLYFWNGKSTETKNNPIQLTFLYALSLVGIYYNEGIMNMFLEIAQDVWGWTINKGDAIGQLSSDMFISGMVTNAGFTIIGILIPAFGTLLSIFKIISIIFAIILLKDFLHLWIEMCERYIVVCLQIFFFPVVIPTCISKDTNMILSSYLRMLVSQLFLLLTGYVFMKGFTFFMDLGIQHNIIGFIFVKGYLRTAQRLDSYLSSMGLNVAQTGAGLFDSFRLAAYSMGATLRGVNEMRKGTAGLVKATAASTGNRALFKAASQIGFNTRDAIKAGGINKVGSDIDFLKNVGMAGEKLSPNSGGKLSVPESVAKEAVNNYIKNPSRENASALRAMHNSDLAKAIQTAGVLPTGMKLDGSNIEALKGTLKVQGTGRDGNFIKGTVSNEKLSKNSIQTSSGNYFTPDNTLKKGSAMQIKNKEDLNNALMRTGTPNASVHIATMEDYKNALKAGNTEAAEAMKNNGIVEAVYNGGQKTGTQLLTGKNSGYSEGLPIGSINSDGEVQMYGRFSEDASIGTNWSQDDKNSQLFDSYYEDREHAYDSDNLPTMQEALNNLSPDVREQLGLDSNNYGYGYNMSFIEDEDGKSYLRCDYKDYDFSQDEINNLYQEWSVAPNAEPQRSKYGQQSIDVYNPETGDAGTMYFSSVAVYGENVGDGNRILTGRYGDDYVVSVQKKVLDVPDPDTGSSFQGNTRINEPFKESPASYAGQELYQDVYAKSPSQDAIDILMEEERQKNKK